MHYIIFMTNSMEKERADSSPFELMVRSAKDMTLCSNKLLSGS